MRKGHGGSLRTGWVWKALLTISAALWLLAEGIALPADAQSAVPPTTVVGVRIGGTAAATRFVLEMTNSTKPEVFTLGSPYRVVVDLPEIAWSLPPNDIGAKGGLVDGFRFGLFEQGRSRLVIDVHEPVAVKSAFVMEPRDGHRYRLVLDIERVAASAFQDQNPAAPKPQPQPVPTAAAPQAIMTPRPPAPQPAPRPRATGDARHIVVVDAGHGGVDPGTIGPGGTYEKDVTIAMARELKARMEASGRYKVVLTRDKDIFIPLRDRVAISRAAGAEMFISLHADSIANRSTRGGTVYTLSEVASDKEAEALAAKENKADLIAGMDLSHESREVASILLDLAQRETMNYSARFASILVEELGKTVQLGINSHRYAGFAVLKAPDVPAVLYEMGYLSNPTEEKELLKPAYRQKMADGIVRAADRFFRERVNP
ncbi:MAG TPA: N-acetylmuramoyl-L-alanine amidase [Alphaproteobacteria bacterium]|jgi:N-acetylmuramoyl-L-alanine amidase